VSLPDTPSSADRRPDDPGPGTERGLPVTGKSTVGDGAGGNSTAGEAVTETREGGVASLLVERSILICCGSGGVGKTTTAAALALGAAVAGRRAVVVTIDPARRLANALGLDSLTNTPKTIEGDWSGELSAVMLDAKGTFDALVTRYATSQEQAERIRSNRLYQNLSSALSGTQEYMAMEKLYELHEESGFDLVVVDTPPTRHALDFLDAPRRLTKFLENRIFRLLLTPTKTYLRAMSIATKTLLRTLSKVAGSEFVEDAIAFFQAFEGMEEGFRQRAARVEQLLSEPGTAFVLVAAPRRDAIEEARFFAEKLAQSHLPVAALVVNRLQPTFGATPRHGQDARATGPLTTGPLRTGPGAGSRVAHPPQPGEALAVSLNHRHGEMGNVSSQRPEDSALAWGYLTANLNDFVEVASLEEEHFCELAHELEPAPVLRVPLLASDVHDLSGLAEVTGYLLTEPLLSERGQHPARE